MRRVHVSLVLALCLLVPASAFAGRGRGAPARNRPNAPPVAQPVDQTKDPAIFNAIVRHMGKRGVHAGRLRKNLFVTPALGTSTIFAFNAATAERTRKTSLRPEIVQVNGTVIPSTRTKSGFSIRAIIRPLGDQLEPLER